MWRSLVAHLFWEQRVAGSNPVIPTDFSRPDRSVRAAFSCPTTLAPNYYLRAAQQPRSFYVLSSGSRNGI